MNRSISPPWWIFFQSIPAAASPTFYIGCEEAHWRETTVDQHGEIVLEDLPFVPGQPVEVLVVSKAAQSATAGEQNLRGSVLEFLDPLAPVATEDRRACGHSAGHPHVRLA
jgi:hypothetical protein